VLVLELLEFYRKGRKGLRKGHKGLAAEY